MDNWYYTLSAIAQTCGAILALGGAFVVFKLDKVKQAIENYRQRFIQIIKRFELKEESTYFGFPEEKVYKMIVDNKEEIIGNDSVRSYLFHVYKIFEKDKAKDWLDRHIDFLKTNIAAKREILFLFIITILILTAVIVLNIYFLGFIELLNKGCFEKILYFSIFSIILSSIFFIKIITRKYIT